MKIIHLIINGMVGATINSEHLDLDKATVKETNSNIYSFESKDIFYKWRQKERGGKVEIIHNDNFHPYGFNSHTLDYIEEGKFYPVKGEILKIIEY